MLCRWRCLAATPRGRSLVGASPPTAFQQLDPGLYQGIRSLEVHAPNAVQQQALEQALNGADVLVMAQTGSGKTLMVLLPILHQLLRKQRTEAIFIAPTADLARQHAAVAVRLLEAVNNPPIVALASSTSGGDTSHGRLRITTPEGVHRLHCSGELAVHQPDIVAIDEVDAILCGPPMHDRLSSAGLRLLDQLHTGRTCELHVPLLALPTNSTWKVRMRQSAAARKQTPPSQHPRLQVLMTTAHLTSAHDAVISRLFPSAVRVQQQSTAGRAGVLVPTLRQRFQYFSGGVDAKVGRLMQVLLSTVLRPEKTAAHVEATMVFCGSSSTAEDLCRLIASERTPGAEGHGQPGSPVAGGAGADDHSIALPVMLHGGMEDAERVAAISSFRSGASNVLVCTNVAARGLDFPAVGHVVLYDAPPDMVRRCGGVDMRV